ncbi:hypothetical protein TcasGA2_TC034102 [Tribolium castaneum]|uniref:Uncharacterized protein n=1 Tax=Tribolium castaneum TaxID=7070 RepID=A0A139WD93_TRICA|nr:hypothetical protein TcasGA2_TC034102 [Tribolium castaneum]
MVLSRIQMKAKTLLVFLQILIPRLVLHFPTQRQKALVLH